MRSSGNQLFLAHQLPATTSFPITGFHGVTVFFKGICRKHSSSCLYGTSMHVFHSLYFFSLLAFLQQNQAQNIHRLERNPCSWVPSVPMRNGECISLGLHRTCLLPPVCHHHHHHHSHAHQFSFTIVY